MLAKKFKLDAMSADDLWLLHERLSGILSTQSRQKSINSKSVWPFSAAGWQIKSAACRCSVKGRGAGIL